MNKDLISRQAAIKTVKRYLVDCHVEDADWHGDGIEYELKNLPSAQQWIPVSERLPEMAGIYLVTNSMIGYDKMEITYFEDGQWDTAGMPIAWMPLPEPFKEG